jgi:hypothetical protein
MRLVGIIVFAFILGLSAHSLRSMHESGQLFARYNYQRRAHITLTGTSVFMLGFLGFFELTRSRRHAHRRKYGERRYPQEHVVKGQHSSNIYSASENRIDDWNPRRTRSSRSRHHDPLSGAAKWMSLLRLTCFTMPFIFAFIYLQHLSHPLVVQVESWIHVLVWACLTAFSVLTACGVCRKKMWGLFCGYIQSVISLLFFPVGTMTGMFLLLGLVGSMPLFTESARDRRQNLRKKTPIAAI